MSGSAYTKVRRPNKEYKFVKRTGRSVVVRRHYRTRKVKVTPRLSSQDRRLIGSASKPEFKKEYGGVIDVNKKGMVERFTTEVGGGHDEVSLPDYEVLWHTHPDKGENPPSPEDVTNLVKNNKQQATVIFNNERAFVVTKTPATARYKSLSEPRLVKLFETVFDKAMASRTPYETYANGLRGLGFHVKTAKGTTGSLEIPIRVVE